MSRLLDLTHTRLGWPARRAIMKPEGTGPRVIAELAKRKLETAIKREKVDVSVGILAADPRSSRTEDPLAVVCEFASKVSEGTLRETQRLAWSFSRSPMLVTVEPSLLRVWTCWRRPLEAEKDFQKSCVENLVPAMLEKPSLSAEAAKALQWIELASGNFFRRSRYSKDFHREQRADHLMLEDLRGATFGCGAS
jgi:hypothetical protein